MHLSSKTCSHQIYNPRSHVHRLRPCSGARCHRQLRSSTRKRSGAHLVFVACASQNGDGAPSATIVWLKHDLRLDDHPGFQQASHDASTLVPFFSIAPELYTHLLRTPSGVEGLLGALCSLRQNLQATGSDLVVRTGGLHSTLGELLQQLPAASIIAEEEVEHRWLQAIQAAVPDQARLRVWKASLFEDEPYCGNFRDFARLRGAPIAPLEAPARLPGLPAGVEPGQLPSAAQLRQLLSEADAAALHPEVLAAASGVSEAWPPEGPLPIAQRLATGGEAAALPALRAYLSCRRARTGTGSSSGSGLELAEELRQAVGRYETAATPLGSFPALFQQALSLGLLSRRRVHAEASQALGSSPALLQRLAGGGAAVPAHAAIAAAEAADFHWHLARADRERSLQGGGAPQHWRWRGHMVDYCAASPADQGAAELPGAPALLLVHGFGAFGEQWRGQLGALAAAGYQVFAPTIPGFGRSEKPALGYSQTLWSDFLRDFVVELIRRPVVVVGNSIGGYISASLAATNPGLVKGLVLVNSAGKIVPGFMASDAAPASSNGKGAGPPAIVADLVSRALFLYLERSVAQTLVRIYPVAPGMADAWLTEEIARAACDPGAVAVFRSVFYLPAPLPLNKLVAELYGGPVLVLQGARDPLNDAPARAAALAAACSNVRVHLLEGGHCPHDEVPAAFNEALQGFMREVGVQRVAGAQEVAVVC